MKNSSRPKAQIYALFVERLRGIEKHQKVLFVGYSQTDLVKTRSSMLSSLKNKTDNISKKFQASNIKPADIKIARLEFCFLTDANERVNHYIKKFDTIKNGLNSEIRHERKFSL